MISFSCFDYIIRGLNGPWLHLYVGTKRQHMGTQDVQEWMKPIANSIVSPKHTGQPLVHVRSIMQIYLKGLSDSVNLTSLIVEWFL